MIIEGGQKKKFINYNSIDDPEIKKLQYVCKDFMNGMCERGNCKFIHDIQLCKRYWRTHSCKFGNECRKRHFVSEKLHDIYISTITNKKVITKSDDKKEFENYRNIDILNEKNNNKNTINELINEYKLNELQVNQINTILMSNKKKVKNTETFIPMNKPVDMRVIYDLGCYQDKLTKKLSLRDVLLVPNLFRDFEEYEIYNRLIDELKNCGIPEEKVIIPWHGNHEIKGTHMIASDWEKWKRNAPTFNIVINRIREFFDMNIKATRLNWYQDTEQWKAFHFDAAKINPEKAKIQNFTVSVSFGRTRDCAFEKDDICKNVISFPIGDGEMYCFARETNENWRHGVLQELPKIEEGRISIVAWGWIEDIE
jgi:hypothetical protein